MSQTPDESFRLARLVAILALDRRTQQDFIADPQTVMEQNSLSADEQEILTAGTFQTVLDYLWEVGTRPTPNDETGG